MKKILLSTATSLAVAAGAWAADLPAPAPVPINAPLTWTGCYVGGNVGGGWTDTSASATSGNNYGSNGAGIVGGGQVGCDYQVGAFVFGVQGLLDGTELASATPPTSGAQPLTNSSTIPWLATLTGRIGFAVVPSWTLIYTKGGGAWVRDNISTAVSANGAPFASTSYTASGWTVGGGIEYMFMTHLSIFLEYDYIGLAANTATYTVLPGNVGAGTTFPINVAQKVQMAILGVSFRF
ncbi:MAG: outer membrane protein [Xanthobacteraceae bacterium]